MGSNQNPIHRDRDKRSDGAQPFKDNKEALNQKESEIQDAAPFPESGDGLTEEQRQDLAKQHASRRLSDVQKDVEDENETG